MSCLCCKVTSLPVDTVRIIPLENFPHRSSSAVPPPQHTSQPQITDDGKGAAAVSEAGRKNPGVSKSTVPTEACTSPRTLRPETYSRHGEAFEGKESSSAAELHHHGPLHCNMEDTAVSQRTLSSSSSVLPDAAPGEPPTCPSCGNTYNFTGRRPRVLSCLHSVCEECLQILFDSCPRYKFTCCPTCRCETVLFTDYGLAALAVDYSILSRLPVKEESLAPSSTVDCEGEESNTCIQMLCQYCQHACSCRFGNAVSFCAIM
ncbi:RING finger protein 208-like [Scleropages formosus]|uniref:RING finger protein 208-like n=1 Tax=Scleropages formosus TaxID=113540 RepID=A0A0P7WJ17_SCLFO|nr:RING finger protein 208 [Scleropages formosus]KPP61279.1 RING finger protein 208-like [Scleropages formosus]